MLYDHDEHKVMISIHSKCWCLYVLGLEGSWTTLGLKFEMKGAFPTTQCLLSYYQKSRLQQKDPFNYEGT